MLWQIKLLVYLDIYWLNKSIEIYTLISLLGPSWTSGLLHRTRNASLSVLHSLHPKNTYQKNYRYNYFYPIIHSSTNLRCQCPSMISSRWHSDYVKKLNTQLSTINSRRQNKKYHSTSGSNSQKINYTSIIHFESYDSKHYWTDQYSLRNRYKTFNKLSCPLSKGGHTMPISEGEGKTVQSTSSPTNKSITRLLQLKKCY